MITESVILAIEGDVLKGVRLEKRDEAWQRKDAASWPLVADGDDGEAAEEDAAGTARDDAAADEAGDVLSPLVTAFKAAAKHFGTREFVLGLPLSRMLVKSFTARVTEDEDALPEAAAQTMSEASPFPDEELRAGFETAAETESGVTAFAAALPEEACADIDEAMMAAQVRVTRTDALALGWLRTLWASVTEEAPARRIVLFDFGGEKDLLLIENGTLVALRGLGAVATADELQRELVLSLLRLGGGAVATDVRYYTSGDVPEEIVQVLGRFGAVRVVRVEDTFGGTEGCARRAVEADGLDVTPETWRTALSESRFTRKLVKALAVAGGIWLLAMGILVGTPFAYDYLAGREKTVMKRHHKAYQEVSDMRARVRLVQKYSDRARGALEMLKQISDRMPGTAEAGMTLSKFSYKREDGVRLSGEADDTRLVSEFKNQLANMATEDNEKIFALVELSGPTERNGKYRFDIVASFKAEEEAGK